MANLMLKEIPRYECLLECAAVFPDLDPSALEAYLHLLRAGDVLGRFGGGYIEAQGISRGRFTVMMLLLDKLGNEPLAMTPAELADGANVTRATMTGLIDSLLKDGLVEIESSTRDRRQKLVRLSEHGNAFLQGMLPGYFGRVARLMGAIPEGERRTLVQILCRIVERAEAEAAVKESDVRPEPDGLDRD